MRKIMFSDRFGLTKAVLEGRKTMTYPQKSHPRNDVKDLSGQKFGMLTVLNRDHKGDDRNWYYKCQCDCGNIVIVRANALTRGNTKSCGCLKARRNTHHLSKTRLYGIWLGMRDRCNNPKNYAYERYGGRGVSICEDWNLDFFSFRQWALQNGYNDELSIERIDVNGNYEPSNCRWATAQEQADNKTCNILITIGDRTQNLQQWCDEYGIKRSTVNTRVRLCGWDYERAITTPIRSHKEYKTRNGNKTF